MEKLINSYYRRVVEQGYLWTNLPKLVKKSVCNKLKSDGFTLNDDGTISKEETGV